MRRLLSFFSMTILVAMLGWATEVTFDLTGGADQTAWEGATLSGVTLSPAQGAAQSAVPMYYSNGDAVRFYKGNTLTVSSSSKITSIVINGTDTKNFVAQTGSTETATGKITWTGSETSVVFDISAACRSNKIVVTVSDGDNPPVNPDPDPDPDPDPEPTGDGDYTRVNSTNSLVIGGKYIIVSEEANVTIGNKNSQVAITLENGAATKPKADYNEYVLGGEAGKYTLKSSNGFLQWTGTSTGVTTANMPSAAANAQWDITFEGNNVWLLNVGSTNRYLLCYTNGSDFRAYTSKTQANTAPVQLYKYVEADIDEVAAPVFSPSDSESYSQPVSVTITTETEGAEIYYTITNDGVTYPAVPTQYSTKYTGPIELTETGTYWINAKAFYRNLESKPRQAYYLVEIASSESQAEAPVIEPNGGNFDLSQTVSISAGGETDMIMYTTDGTTPSFEYNIGEIYEAPFTITKSTVVKAIALDTDAIPTEVVTAEFKLNPPVAPEFSPADGTEFEESLNVTIASGNAVAIVYTLDGSEPSLENENALMYDETGITITETTTIKAVAYNNDDVASEVVTATYTKQGSDQPVVNTFARINQLSNLKVGETYLIVNEANNTTVVNSASQTSEITLNEGVATLDETTTVNQYVLGGEAGAYTLVANEKYLQYGGTSTTLSWKALPEDVTLAQWDITFDGNNVVLKNVKSERVIYAYNSGNNNEFRLYSNPNSDCTPIQFYMKGLETPDPSVEPVEPTEVGAPTINPESKEFSEAFDATITAGENGVSLVYVLNEGEEVAVAETTVTVAIPAENTTLTAYSVAEDGTRSEAATATYTYKSGDEPQPVEEEYARINNVADLEVGATYIIVCENNATAHSLTDTQSSDIKLGNGVASLTEGSKVNEFTLGGEEDAYTLSVGEKVLQSNTGTNLKFNTVAEGDEAKAQWKITFDGNNAVLVNVANERQILAYQNTKFRAYANAGTNEVYAIQLYKKGGAQSLAKGDVNADGVVNTGDISALYEIITGVQTDEAVIERGKINDDDEVNVGDVSSLYDLILGVSN